MDAAGRSYTDIDREFNIWSWTVLSSLWTMNSKGFSNTSKDVARDIFEQQRSCAFELYSTQEDINFFTGIDFRRDVCRCQILTSKVDPRTKRSEIFYMVVESTT